MCFYPFCQLCLLIGEFNTFTFKIITDREGHTFATLSQACLIAFLSLIFSFTAFVFDFFVAPCLIHFSFPLQIFYGLLFVRLPQKLHYNILKFQQFKLIPTYISVVYTNSYTALFLHPTFFSFFNKFIFWLHWIFVTGYGLSVVAVSGSYSSLWCLVFSLRWRLVAEHGLQVRGLQQLWHTGSVVVAQGLQSADSVVVVHRLSCSAACVIFPDQGLEPMPSALAGGFLTTAPPRKSPTLFLMSQIMCLYIVCLLTQICNFYALVF